MTRTATHKPPVDPLAPRKSDPTLEDVLNDEQGMRNLLLMLRAAEGGTSDWRRAAAIDAGVAIRVLWRAVKESRARI